MQKRYNGLQIGYNLIKEAAMAEQKAAGKTAAAEQAGGLMYKGHPLRRKDNLIYYGSMADKYIIMIQVMGAEKEGELELANKVHLQLQLTDPDLKSRDRVVKKSDLPDLFSAIDMGSIWLMRALAGK